MRENLLALDGAEALRNVARLVQIDDGWSELLETARPSASWRPNKRFPSGIAPLADAVTRRGRGCGLWILPFTVNEGSSLALTHPEYLVRDEFGAPMQVGGGASYCLDPFAPGARDWLKELFSRVAEWGVSYIKLDFLRALLMVDPDATNDDFDVPRVHRERVTRVEAYRAGLALIREAVGDEVFLVGCSAPAGPGMGLVDAHRVGPDIEPEWVGSASGIRDATRSLAANYFWHGRAWVNDPDYLVAATSTEESRFWATAVGLSGGSSIISADLGDLPAWQEEIFATVTPPTGRSARPLDLFEHPAEPAIWHLPTSEHLGPWQALGLFNWKDRPREISVELTSLGFYGPVHVWDVWRKKHRLVANRLTMIVEGRSAALFTLRAAADAPAVVGTSMHFSPPAASIKDEHWDGSSLIFQWLVGESVPRSGTVAVWAPPGLRFERALRQGQSGNMVHIPVVPGACQRLTFVRSFAPRTSKRADRHLR